MEGVGIGVWALSQAISVSSRICSFHICYRHKVVVNSWSLVISRLIS